MEALAADTDITGGRNKCPNGRSTSPLGSSFLLLVSLSLSLSPSLSLSVRMGDARFETIKSVVGFFCYRRR